MTKLNHHLTYISGRLRSHRQALMGIAIFLIMFCHNSMWTRIAPLGELNRYAKVLAQVGVDIFLFCSGYGLYFSWKKSGSLLTFYRKRAVRILPAYFIVMALWCLCQAFFGEDVCLSLKRFSLLTFFTEGELTIWYIPGILLLYGLYPLLFRLCQSGKRLILFSAGLICLSFWIALTPSEALPWGLEAVNEVLLVRIPVFLLGSCCARLNGEARPISRWVWLAFGLLLMAGIVLSVEHVTALSYWWVNRLLFLPLVLCLVSLLLPCLEKGGVVYRLFAFLGGITLELYLIHERVLYYLDTYILPASVLPNLGSPFESACVNLLSMGISALLAYFLHRLCSRLFLSRT